METPNAEVDALIRREYQHGFVTDLESDTVPPGLDEDVVRLISRKKGEPGFLLDWRLKAYRHWLTMKEPRWANVTHAPIDYDEISYYSAPKSKDDGPKSLDEVDPRLLETYEKLGIPLEERAALAGVAVDAVFDSVSVATTFKDKLAEQGIVFCSFSDGGARAPGARGAVSRHRGSVHRQLLRRSQLRRLQRRLVLLHPQGRDAARWSCPRTSGSMRRRTGQFERTLVVADEGSYVSYLEGVHRTGARREPAPRRGGRARRPRRRGDQVLDRAELVSRKRGRSRRHLQLRHQARALPGRQLEDLLDPGRDRLGDHVEVPELHPARRQLGRRVLLGRAQQPAPAGGHRHEDDPPRAQHPQHHRVEGHLGRARPEFLPGSRPDRQGRGERPQLHPVRLAADGRQVRRPHVPVHGGEEPERERRARGDHLEDQRRPASSIAASAESAKRTRSR